jgi:hypothetical protein
MNGLNVKLTDRGIERDDFYIYPEFYKIGSTMSWDEFLKSLNVKSTVKSAFKELCPEVLGNAFGEMESSPEIDRRVAAVFMNARDYSSVRKFGNSVLDVETSRFELQKGHMAMMWGSLIIVNTKVPIHTILLVSDEIFKDVVILKISEETCPQAQELIAFRDKIDELSKEIQSACSKARKLIYDTVEIVERHKAPDFN